MISITPDINGLNGELYFDGIGIVRTDEESFVIILESVRGAGSAQGGGQLVRIRLDQDGLGDLLNTLEEANRLKKGTCEYRALKK